MSALYVLPFDNSQVSFIYIHSCCRNSRHQKSFTKVSECGRESPHRNWYVYVVYYSNSNTSLYVDLKYVVGFIDTALQNWLFLSCCYLCCCRHSCLPCTRITFTLYIKGWVVYFWCTYIVFIYYLCITVDMFGINRPSPTCWLQTHGWGNEQTIVWPSCGDWKCCSKGKYSFGRAKLWMRRTMP